MRFGYDDDEAAFGEAVRELLAKECTAGVVRAAWDAGPGQLDRSLWEKLAAMGALGVAAPESVGGLGFDEVALVAILEEAGRACVPYPLVETAAVAAPLGVTDGRLVTASLGASLAPCALDADAIIVDHDGALLLCTPKQVQLEAVVAVDRTRRLARVSGVADDATVLAEGVPALEAAFDRAALATAAQLVGLGQAMLDMTVAYVKERQQFGVPIGSFQAVKHHLADAHKDLSFARPAVQRAAWSVANEAPTRSRDVSMAKAMASDAAAFVARNALQCHGAIGYTLEHDLHLYLKRTWALCRSYGDAPYHRDRVATVLGV
ncbi:MAG: acyl-CoA dehydrogenase family protein [Acidimicrobiales bacterium]